MAAVQEKSSADQEKNSSGEYVVLDRAFVGYVDKERKRVERFTRGQIVKLDSDIHDIEHLVRMRAVARRSDVEANGATPATALEKSQLSAQVAQEDSPVLDLTVQPSAPAAEDVASATNPE